MANVQERTGATGIKTYRVGYRDDSGKYKYTPTMMNEDDAWRIKEIIEEQGYEIALQILGATQGSYAITLREWFPRHLAIRAIEVTDGTIAEYEREAERTWMPRLGDFPLDTITKDMVIDWIAWQMKQPTHRSQVARQKAEEAGLVDLPDLVPVKPKTVRNAHSLLSATLESAVEAEHIARNVARGAPLPKDDIEDEKEIFSHAEWERFHTAMQAEYKDFTAFLLVVGCRINEATPVQVRDFDPANRVIRIVRAMKKARQGKVLGAPKSRRSRRVVMLPDWAVGMLKERCKGKKPDDLIFTTPTGKQIKSSNYSDRQWKRALKEAKITKHITPHSARHTFASWALMSGVAPQVVQHRLGHESLATTSEVYGHLLLDAQEAAVDAIKWEPRKELE